MCGPEEIQLQVFTVNLIPRNEDIPHGNIHVALLLHRS
jgi:hypothetical protein